MAVGPVTHSVRDFTQKYGDVRKQVRFWQICGDRPVEREVPDRA